MLPHTLHHWFPATQNTDPTPVQRPSIILTQLVFPTLFHDRLDTRDRGRKYKTMLHVGLIRRRYLHHGEFIISSSIDKAPAELGMITFRWE